MSSRRLFLATLLLAAAGCADVTSPGEQGQLDAARARWHAQGSDSHTVELTRGCFCVLGGRRMTVTVKHGAVVGADYLDSGGPVETALLTYIPTIPDLFDLIPGRPGPETRLVSGDLRSDVRLSDPSRDRLLGQRRG